MANKLSWSDLRIILEVARHGSIHSASKVLRVDHSTVTRRISQIESSLQRQLFNRSNRGIEIRPEAAGLLQHILFMDQHACAVDDEIARNSEGGSRRVRIATMEGLATGYLANRIDAITRQAPDIHIELFSNPHIVDLLKKETDLFISFFNPSISGLVSQQVADCSIFLYASKKYEETYGLPNSCDQLNDHRYVSYIGEMVTIDSVRWLDEFVTSPNIVFSSNSVFAQKNAAISGVGLVALPVFVGETCADLKKILPNEINLKRSIWLSVSREQSFVPSIRTAAQSIAGVFQADADFLLGRSPPADGADSPPKSA